MAASTPPSEDSYTKMDSADLESIGAHCQFPYCHQLDFLPFRCDSCKSTFCLDHRSETAHKCSRAGEWAKNRRKNSVGRPTTTTTTTTGLSGPTLTGLAPTTCSEAHCQTTINTVQHTGSRCDNCNRQYCLKHRFREAHDCHPTAPLTARRQQAAHHLDSQTQKMRLGFSRLRAWGKDKQEALKPTPKPSSRATQLGALNALKQNAKGDANLPPDKRIYLHVEAEAATTTSKLPTADLYFSAEWSVGRMLDEAAKRLQVANVNNRVETEEQRLRVYHVEAGRLLEFGERLGVGVQSGNTVVLLRGVGPAAPELREA